jgi:hypothetical protein
LNRIAAILFLLLSVTAWAQEYHTLRGYVTDANAEPLIGVYIRVANLNVGTVSNEKGQYEIKLPEGLNRISYTYMGFQTQVVDLVIRKEITQNIRLEEAENNLKGVEINNRKKDLSYEIIQQVIDKREEYQNQFTTQKRHIYVKSVEKNTFTKEDKDDKELAEDLLKSAKDSLPNLNLFEGDFTQHVKPPNGFKEEKEAAKKLGSQRTLFFTSTTDANFDFNENLIYVKKLGDNQYISPISSTAMLAYKYKLVGSRFEGDQKIYTIKVTPRKMGNALFKGELEVWDSLFTIKSVSLELSKNSLILYDKFSVHQQYVFSNGRRILASENFTWQLKTSKSTTDGRCEVVYSKYVFDSTYAKKYFNAEVGVTKEDAYEKDTGFWASIRPVPLTEEEYQFITYQDSVIRLHTSKHYLDSIDSVYNKPTFMKIAWAGLGHINRDKKTHWDFDPITGIIDPVPIGGWRLRYSVNYFKKFENRKAISVSPFINYGLRNRDVKGNLGLYYLYNPKKISSISLNTGKYFGFVNNFATILDIFNRNNFYEERYASLYHRTELINGLYSGLGLRSTYRQDLGDFKFNPEFDSVFVDNNPKKFDSHSAFILRVGLSYTPKQLYIQEPKEKIILGSKYPTFSLYYAQALPKFFGSSTNYKVLDFGISQKFNIGIFGTSEYSINVGEFLDTSLLRIMDYRYQRGGDKFLLLPTMFGYQLIDSTFATFGAVVESHYNHEFNGFITSKIPGLKQLDIRTSAGGGVLYVPERKYQYAELLFGANRIFKIGKDRYKLGVYYVVAQNNTSGFASGFKFSINPYNADTSTWSF